MKGIQYSISRDNANFLNRENRSYIVVFAIKKWHLLWLRTSQEVFGMDKTLYLIDVSFTKL